MRYFVTLRSGLFCLVGLICTVVGLIYLTNSGAHLPRFLPGHVGHGVHSRIYFERALLLFAVAVIALRNADRISRRALGDY
jgi:hypothetical protein